MFEGRERIEYRSEEKELNEKEKELRKKIEIFKILFEKYYEVPREREILIGLTPDRWRNEIKKIDWWGGLVQLARIANEFRSLPPEENKVFSEKYYKGGTERIREKRKGGIFSLREDADSLFRSDLGKLMEILEKEEESKKEEEKLKKEKEEEKKENEGEKDG